MDMDGDGIEDAFEKKTLQEALAQWAHKQTGGYLGSFNSEGPLPELDRALAANVAGEYRSCLRDVVLSEAKAWPDGIKQKARQQIESGRVRRTELVGAGVTGPAVDLGAYETVLAAIAKAPDLTTAKIIAHDGLQSLPDYPGRLLLARGKLTSAGRQEVSLHVGANHTTMQIIDDAHPEDWPEQIWNHVMRQLTENEQTRTQLQLLGLKKTPHKLADYEKQLQKMLKTKSLWQAKAIARKAERIRDKPSPVFTKGVYATLVGAGLVAMALTGTTPLVALVAMATFHGGSSVGGAGLVAATYGALKLGGINPFALPAKVGDWWPRALARWRGTDKAVEKDLAKHTEKDDLARGKSLMDLGSEIARVNDARQKAIAEQQAQQTPPPPPPPSQPAPSFAPPEAAPAPPAPLTPFETSLVQTHARHTTEFLRKVVDSPDGSLAGLQSEAATAQQRLNDFDAQYFSGKDRPFPDMLNEFRLSLRDMAKAPDLTTAKVLARETLRYHGLLSPQKPQVSATSAQTLGG